MEIALLARVLNSYDYAEPEVLGVTSMGFLSDEDRAKLTPSELLSNETPIPTQVVSSDEYFPFPQTEKQKELQARLLSFG